MSRGHWSDSPIRTRALDALDRLVWHVWAVSKALRRLVDTGELVVTARWTHAPARPSCVVCSEPPIAGSSPPRCALHAAQHWSRP